MTGQQHRHGDYRLKEMLISLSVAVYLVACPAGVKMRDLSKPSFKNDYSFISEISFPHMTAGQRPGHEKGLVSV